MHGIIDILRSFSMHSMQIFMLQLHLLACTFAYHLRIRVDDAKAAELCKNEIIYRLSYDILDDCGASFMDTFL